MSADSVVRKGIPDRVEGGASQFLKIGDGESAVFAPMIDLDELITVDLHGFWNVNPAVLVACLHEDCPACSAGNSTNQRSYLPVQLRSGETNILSAGPMIINQLLDIREEIGTVLGKVFKLSRKGSGLSTRWLITALGKDVPIDGEMPDILGAIGPFEREGIVAKLTRAGIVTGTGAKAAAPAEVEELEDEW